MSTEIVLVRHGETEGESSIRLHGATDVRLSALGREQMERVRDALDGEAFDRVVVSPLRRSIDSASIVAPGGPEPTVVESFREIDFGRWEGLTFAEIAARDPDGYREFLRGDMAFTFPGGERRSAFDRRVTASVPAALDGEAGRVLAVLHKGVIKLALSALLDLPRHRVRRFSVALGGIHRVRGEVGARRLVARDRTDHLGALHVPDGSPAPG